MKFLEKIRKSAGYLLLAGALAAGGCSANFPITEWNKNKEGIYADSFARLNWQVLKSRYGLSREKRTVPVHPGDGGASVGEVVMNNDTSTAALGAGLEGSVGTEFLRLKIGGDIKAEIPTVEEKLQNLPPPYESYGYMTIHQKGISFKPFVGLEVILDDKFKIGVEVGRIYTEYKYEVGHYRWNNLEPIGKDTCNARGNSLNITISYKIDKTLTIGIIYGIDKYDTHLGGEETGITVQSFSGVAGLRF